MSLEVRLEKLETQHRNLDADVHSLARVCADIKNIALTNQHDIAGLKLDVSGVKTDLAGVKACIAALTEATHAGFKRADEQHNEFVRETRQRFDEHDKRFDEHDKRFDEHDKRFDEVDRRFDKVDERFDRLELLIRQRIPNTQN
ncbi:hypothetical protein [Endozoicomonas sp. ALD040]|uniref:hypothetical protein n=1 Tax=unclassified Endozoicomonas TaxID=2644528 RepID=UPI003BB00B6A